MALMRTTKITERVSTEFGVQVFNIFNHAQFGDPSPGNLAFNYQPASDSAGNPIPNQWMLHQLLRWVRSTRPTISIITTITRHPRTPGTGLPRQIQFMLRFEF